MTDDDALNPPEEIGPHEGRELELMLRGAKPLAYFSERLNSEFEFPDDAFEPFVKDGRIIKREYLRTDSETGEGTRILFFALPEEAWRIERAYAARTQEWSKPGPESDEHSTEFGRLLGYSEHEISVFLGWKRQV